MVNSAARVERVASTLWPALSCISKETVMADLPAMAWRKSTRSGLDGCVEVAFIEGTQVAVRHSKDRSGPVLTFDAGEWQAFVDGVNNDEFDLTG
jgi:hypothetical protein